MPAARKARSVSDASSAVRIQAVEGQRPAGRLLGDELRFHRERLGYTLSEAAEVIRASTSKVSRLERGESPAKPRDVHDLAVFYGLSRDERGQLEQLVSQVVNADLYERFADVTPQYLKRLIRLEGSAQKISVFEPRVVPGLLQTGDYARAMVRLVADASLPDADVERVVALRKERQVRLGKGAPRLVAVICEEVLYRPYGGPRVMAEQMEFLLRATGEYRVNVRILGRAAVTPPHPIFHLGFADGQGQELAYVEHLDGANYITQKRQLDRYRWMLDTVRAQAHDRTASLHTLTGALEHWTKEAASVTAG
ncbi:helix-turn-helix transcriptional regulator [Streptomyces sp. NPDC020875]|uniref:helix-turn-helix domain-containing protein n=1 Tax=Streptomyces sp. NPDC020875 TaxID=3154898 RepID=UPI0033D35AF6